VRYRKIDPRIWNDEKFRALSDDGKLVFLLILTHTHMTALGAMRKGIAGLAEDMGWELSRMTKAFGEAFGEGLVEADAKAQFLGAPKFLKYNPPESPNVVTAWVKAWDDIPECALKVQLWYRVEAFLKAFGEAFLKAWAIPSPKPLAKPLANQEQEQEQEQEQKDAPPETAPAAAPISPDEIIESWNKLSPQFKKACDWSKKRNVALGARVRESFWRDNWRAALEKLPSSPFLRGESERGWKANLDWFLKPDSVTKIMEGQYDGVGNARKGVGRGFESAAGDRDKFKNVAIRVSNEAGVDTRTLPTSKP
jgi:hypothetical protein